MTKVRGGSNAIMRPLTVFLQSSVGGQLVLLGGSNPSNPLKRGKFNTELETVSIAEPLQNRQHARETPNAVNTRRERE